MYLTVNGITKGITATEGFPQGGVCSAKFWIIAFNEAIEIINKRGVYGNGFADDCVALIGGDKLDHMMSRLQKIVWELEEWGLGNGLIFNAKKTEVVIFTRATLKNDQIPNKLLMGNTAVEYSLNAKYLGVILDCRLNWTLQIEKIIKKGKQTLHALKRATSKKWGPKPRYMKWMYNAIVRPRMTYAAICWGPALRYETQRDKLNMVNNLAASMISNTRRSTPRAALQIMYDLPPLDLVVNYEALASLSRNKHVIVKDWPGQNKQSRTLIGHILYWERKAKTMGIDLEDTDKRKQDSWEKLYTVNQDSFKNEGEPIPAQISIYTDGSKTEEHVGAGFVIYRQGNEIEINSTRLAEEITVYQAEVLAIKLAVDKFREIRNPEDRYIKIFCDSQAALKSLNTWKIKSKLVHNTIQSLNTLATQVKRLELNWIKAHNNYKGNERADELARNAVYENIIFFGVDPP